MEYIPEIIDSFGRNETIAVLFAVVILGVCYTLSNVSSAACIIFTHKNVRKIFQNLLKRKK